MQTTAGAKKAAETKRKKAAERVWAEVEAVQKLYSCSCKLHKGMDWEALAKLGAGCTAPRWVCPVLDKYRRLIITAGGYPDYSDELEDHDVA